MKKIYLSAALLACASLAFGQVGATRTVGQSTEIAKTITSFTQAAIDKHDAGAAYSLPTPSGINLTGIVNLKEEKDGQITIAGGAGNKGTFNFTADDAGNVSGTFYSIADRIAYKYATVAGNLVATEIPIGSILCMDYARAPISASEQAEIDNLPARTAAIPKYSSKPGSSYV